MNWPPITFTLNSGVWQVVRTIDSGSVGQVFEVVHVDTSERGAIKAMAAEGGDRDGLAAELHREGVRNIVPVLETGSDHGMRLYRMPLAEKSLRDHLEGNPGPRPEAEVIAVLGDVAIALLDMGNRVFHRDIKPENLLRHNNAWRVNDFGSARDQAAKTATHTHNMEAMNAYTAPERWQHENSAAADVYSLGIVAYEMLAGHRPFPGPTVADYKTQHTNQLAPPLASTSVRLATLVQQMLAKDPRRRAAPQHIIDTIAQMRDETPAPSAGADALRRVNLTAVRAHEEHAALEASYQQAAKQRQALREDALDELFQIGIELKNAVYAAASEAAPLLGAHDKWTISLMGAGLYFELDEDNIPSTRTTDMPFDVLATAQIALRLPPDPQRGISRGLGEFSHSLWYCDPVAAGSFGWHETAFATRTDSSASPGATTSGLLVPRAESVTTNVMDALRGYNTTTICVWPFELVTPGDLQGFIDRWLRWFADVATGALPQADHHVVEKGWRTTV